MKWRQRTSEPPETVERQLWSIANADDSYLRRNVLAPDPETAIRCVLDRYAIEYNRAKRIQVSLMVPHSEWEISGGFELREIK